MVSRMEQKTFTFENGESHTVCIVKKEDRPKHAGDISNMGDGKLILQFTSRYLPSMWVELDMANGIVLMEKDGIEHQIGWLVSDGKITKIEINYPGFIGVWIHALTYSLNLCKSSSHHLARCAAFSMGV